MENVIKALISALKPTSEAQKRGALLNPNPASLDGHASPHHHPFIATTVPPSRVTYRLPLTSARPHRLPSVSSSSRHLRSTIGSRLFKLHRLAATLAGILAHNSFCRCRPRRRGINLCPPSPLRSPASKLDPKPLQFSTTVSEHARRRDFSTFLHDHPPGSASARERAVRSGGLRTEPRHPTACLSLIRGSSGI